MLSLSRFLSLHYLNLLAGMDSSSADGCLINHQLIIPGYMDNILRKLRDGGIQKVYSRLCINITNGTKNKIFSQALICNSSGRECPLTKRNKN